MLSGHRPALALVILVSLLGAGAAPGASGAPDSEPGAGGPPVRLKLPVRRDTVLSAAPGERDANLGGARRLKTKGIVELTLFDVHVERLRGGVAVDPVLHVRGASDDPQLRVTVSGVAADWVEGTSTGYRPEPGAASFSWAALGERRWAWVGSDVTAVINGAGHTLWAFADAGAPDADGWQRVAISPRVFAARVAGLSGGFALTDDVGNEYRRAGDALEYRVFPNRLIWSRESGPDSAPFVTVGIGPIDREPPDAIDSIIGAPAIQAALGPGEAAVRFRTPADLGAAGTLGFDVRIAREPPFDWERAEPLPRYLIPPAGAPGDPVEVTLRDLGLAPGARVRVGVRAVDGAGNRGPVTVATVALNREPEPLELAPLPGLWRSAGAGGSTPEAAPRLGRGEVYVIDPLDKVNPTTGELIPERPDGYLLENHIWSAGRRSVRLAAARNELVAFQVVVPASGSIEAALRFVDAPPDCRPEVEVLRFVAIPSELGPLPDPLVPPDSAIESSAAAEARSRSLLVDLRVPHDCPAGEYLGALELASGGERLELAVSLRVWNFTLPDHLSFVPQMNSYGLPPPPDDLAYYRLAHRHRTCLNLVPYSWRGEVFRGYEPDGSGRDAWRAWDARFGPLLDGSAFDDLPRAGVPVDAFYLPLNENWPAPIENGFGGGYWAERALSAEYRQAFVDGARRFAEHFEERGWRDTFFEFYLNNKLYHRREGWGRSSAYWVFDEPINTQDFWALRWYASAFHEGVARAARGDGGRAKLAFRADISRPQWQRDLLDGLLDVNVVGIGFAPYLRTVLDRKRRNGEVLYNYGTSNRVESSNVQPAAWSVWAWSVGADGVLPWKTVGRESSWKKASPLALFYPAPGGGAHPSIRLKAYRRGQQDVEYLTILAAVTGQPRRALGERVRQEAGLRAVAVQNDSSDAGRLDFAEADAVALWRLRMRVGATLDRLAPPDRRRWVDLRVPPRDSGAVRAAEVLVVD